MNRNDKYYKLKIILARITGIGVFIVSAIFSQSGFGFSEPKMSWVGWILAIAVTVAELIFNTRLKNLNWTIVVVGLMAYIYSIWTNIVGFYSLQGTTLVWGTTAIVPILGSIFMDIYPEMAIAWSFGESTDGDFIGNLVKLQDEPFKTSSPKYVPKHKPQFPTNGAFHTNYEDKDK